jgi:site-specific recombinase XerD
MGEDQAGHRGASRVHHRGASPNGSLERQAMSRGRPRLHDPSIPAHIDQAKIPIGAYWARADRVWYTIVEEAGKKRRLKLIGSDAKLSDLHRMLEDAGGVQRGTLGWLCDQFHASDKFKGLADKTRADYAAQRKLLSTFKTKAGLLADLRVSGITSPFLVRVFEKIGSTHPAKANHLLRYVRRVFSWCAVRGYCTSNPAKGIEQAKERKQRRLPSHDVQNTIIEYARANHADYLWIVMELAYLCRLRGIEVLTLTDANEMPGGIETNRRKGSNDSLVQWSPRLSAAWQAAQARRARIWHQQATPHPMRADARTLLVNAKGNPITRGTLDTLWRTMMLKAIAENVITTDQRFGCHDLKRRGITDTIGGKAGKQAAGGHKTAAMLDVYDFEIPEVTTPGGV